MLNLFGVNNVIDNKIDEISATISFICICKERKLTTKLLKFLYNSSDIPKTQAITLYGSINLYICNFFLQNTDTTYYYINIK